MLALHLLQAALVHVNALLVQRVRTSLEGATHRRGPPGPHRAVLVERPPLRLNRPKLPGPFWRPGPEIWRR